MDYQHILTLVAALTGTPGEEFAALKTHAAELKAPIAQIVCPRPMLANEIEGKTVFCGTVQVPEDHAKPDGKKITLKFAVLKSWSQYPEPDPVVYSGRGGTVDAADLKSASRMRVWVRFPPPAPQNLVPSDEAANRLLPLSPLALHTARWIFVTRYYRGDKALGLP